MIQNELFLEQSLLSGSRLEPKQIAGAWPDFCRERR